MLVLSRRNRESVVIGGADGFHRILKVTVLRITGGVCAWALRSMPASPSTVGRFGNEFASATGQTA